MKIKVIFALNNNKRMKKNYKVTSAITGEKNIAPEGSYYILVELSTYVMLRPS